MIPFYFVLSLLVVVVILSALAIRIAAFQWKQKKGLSYQPSVHYHKKNREEIATSEPTLADSVPDLPVPEVRPQIEIPVVLNEAPVITVAENPVQDVPATENQNREYARKRWLRSWIIGEIID
ncbi:MAG: hypothetical protein K1X92_13015 [Bacteroidia bacterium]|nr:hypothetical protein [Bacteroidia bacterium]